jgi:hypothetical protein
MWHSDNEPHIQYIFPLYESSPPHSLPNFPTSSFFHTLLSSLNSLPSWSNTSKVMTVELNHPQEKIGRLIKEVNLKTYNSHVTLLHCIQVPYTMILT